MPRWLRDSGKGWVTAEYAMLPGSSPSRVRRSHVDGGRAKEISRLIGRALRAAVDMKAMSETMVRVDCDVIEADGGNPKPLRFTGAWVALHQALEDAVSREVIARNPIIDVVAAISVGIVDGEKVLDLDYEKDVSAEVDMNVVYEWQGFCLWRFRGLPKEHPSPGATLTSCWIWRLPESANSMTCSVGRRQVDSEAGGRLQESRQDC